MDESRADLLQHRIELYRATLRAGARGRVAIEYLRQIESDEAELSQIRRAQESHLTSRGLSADQRPIRSLAKSGRWPNTSPNCRPIRLAARHRSPARRLGCAHPPNRERDRATEIAPSPPPFSSLSSQPHSTGRPQAKAGAVRPRCRGSTNVATGTPNKESLFYRRPRRNNSVRGTREHL